MKKWLVIGLGNPEQKYAQTWHNLGFWAAERFAQEVDIVFKKKGNTRIADFKDKRAGAHVFVVEPLTYMNRSGEVVVHMSRKHKIAPENIIVVYDDLYIDKGKIRIVRGGSGAGHNGIRSINDLLGAKDYLKLKVGIKPAKPPHSTSNYVLSRIGDDERAIVMQAIDMAAEAISMIVTGERFEIVQGKFNCKNEGNA